MIRETEAQTEDEVALLSHLQHTVEVMSDPAYYAQHPGRKYVCHEELVLELGGFFRPKLNTLKKLQGYQNDCYRNVLVNMLQFNVESEALHYVEGYALSILPFNHAWNTTDSNKSLEVTWPKIGKAYYGIPLKRDFVILKSLETEKHGILSNDWKVKMKLLEKGISTDDILWE